MPRGSRELLVVREGSRLAIRSGLGAPGVCAVLLEHQHLMALGFTLVCVAPTGLPAHPCMSIHSCPPNLFACCPLCQVPDANVQWDDKTEGPVPFKGVNIAVAVATPTGLITPVVRDAGRKTVTQASGLGACLLAAAAVS